MVLGITWSTWRQQYSRVANRVFTRVTLKEDLQELRALIKRNWRKSAKNSL